ncbi:MAG: MoaD/ThiS family protein [Pirellulaceae bacterium]|jgi:molybdopterin converting factor small subunit|nr:MoaD/ThiS family protein [Pirellulaceae bacterium]HJN09365.1 MoaD/ThiS family protein [Pirellulaceae bacterium]
MVRVFIPSSLRKLTDDQSPVEVAATTLREAIVALEQQFPGIQQQLCLRDSLMPTLQVSIDETMTRRMSAALKPDSEIHFLPAIGGG